MEFQNVTINSPTAHILWGYHELHRGLIRAVGFTPLVPDPRSRESPVSVVGKSSLKSERRTAGLFPDTLPQPVTDKPEDLPGRNLTKRGMK